MPTRAILREPNSGTALVCGTAPRGANLSEANLQEAKLRRANLRGASLYRANLRWAKLGGAIVTDEQLNAATSLAGATLADGTMLPNNFKGRLPYDKPATPTGVPPTPPPTAPASPAPPADGSPAP